VVDSGIAPPKLEEVIRAGDGELSRMFDTLHDAMFAGTCRRSINPRGEDHTILKYPYILYLELSEAQSSGGIEGGSMKLFNSPDWKS